MGREPSVGAVLRGNRSEKLLCEPQSTKPDRDTRPKLLNRGDHPQRTSP